MILSYEQDMAVKAKESKVVVVAAAGSGKTRVITERVRYLLSIGEDPNSIYAITFTNNAAQEMRDRLTGLQGIEDVFIGTIHSLANRILVKNGIKTTDAIESQDFNKLFYLIKNSEVMLPPVHHLLIDEFQDISKEFYEFYFYDLRPDNFFAVGDGRQCQPEGTKIRLRNNIFKNIEDVQVGDSVVWYDNKKSYVCGPTNSAKNSIEKKIEKIHCRDFYNDNIITIKTENGNSSKYTPNHITFVKLNESDYNHAVYLMCDDNYRFRIGKIPFHSNRTTSNPWRDKMYQEGCSKIWILKVFKTDKEARVLETKLSYKYQIPQTCWQFDKVRWTKEDLDFIYEGLDTKKTAELCLKEFNRDINFPLLDKNKEKSDKIHFATNAVTEIYASNLMPEVMSCLVYNPELKHRKQYEKITEVNYNFIKSPIKVYSLQVEGETYVADNIITHNCIYGFSGGSLEWMNKTIDGYGTKVYELNDCYRCPQNILNFANKFISGDPDVYFTDTTSMVEDQGTILTKPYSEENLVKNIKMVGDFKNWFVLCRTNQQVSDTLDLLYNEGIPAETFKKADNSLEDLAKKMNNDTVKVLTIHSAKGLEAEHVAVIGAKNFNAEEKRLCYVAATRAKRDLIWYKSYRGLRAKTSVYEDSRLAFGNIK